MLQIKPLTGELESEYRRFVSEAHQSLIYASLEYRTFLTNVVAGSPCYLVALENGRIVGALPCFKAQQPDLGVVVNSLPWYGSHGGCTLSSQERSDVRERLLTGYREIVLGEEMLSSTIILTHAEDEYIEQYRKVLNPLFIDRRIGQITYLPSDGRDLERSLERSFAQKTRNLVKKSLKQGFSFESSDDETAWGFLWRTHRTNMEAIGGKAKPWEHFLALCKCLPVEWRRVWVARLGGQPVAALLLLYFARTVEYFTPVVLQEYRSFQPLSFLIWHCMIDAVRRGFRCWNWGGTWPSQKSLHHFKAGWGACDEPYSYLITTTESALARLKANQSQVQAAFPYYYTHPYN